MFCLCFLDAICTCSIFFNFWLSFFILSGNPLAVAYIPPNGLWLVARNGKKKKTAKNPVVYYVLFVWADRLHVPLALQSYNGSHNILNSDTKQLSVRPCPFCNPFKGLWTEWFDYKHIKINPQLNGPQTS